MGCPNVHCLSSLRQPVANSKCHEAPTSGFDILFEGIYRPLYHAGLLSQTSNLLKEASTIHLFVVTDGYVDPEREVE